MKLHIGETLKQLRKKREITQEELAERLGVSCQSVSRWELGVCYPDIELLPVLAEFFSITVDKLLGTDSAVEREKIDNYLKAFQKAVSEGDIDRCIRIAREGVTEFPNDYALLNKLMYALFLSGDDDGNDPDWKANMEKYDAEITAIGERIMKYCPDQEVRLEAVSRLAFNHCEMGRKKQGRAVYETLPSMQLCRENQIWPALEEEERLPFARDLIEKGYHCFRAGLYQLVYGKLLPDEELVMVYQKMSELDQLVYDKDAFHAGRYLAQIYCGAASAYARLGKTEEALAQLRLAAESAAAFDARPENGKVCCLLLGEKEWKRTDFETSDTRNCREIMRDKWLADTDFDALRDTAGYQEIVQKLLS